MRGRGVQLVLRFMIVSLPAISRKISRSRHYKWWVFLALAIGTFTSVADFGSLNVTMPTIAEHFGTDLPTTQWVLIGYALAISALLLPMGRLSDIVGRKRVYVGGFRHLRRGRSVRGDVGQHPDAHRVQGLAGRGREHDAGDRDGDGAVHFPERGARQGDRVVHHGRRRRERGGACAGPVHRGNTGLAVGILLRGGAGIAGDPGSVAGAGRAHLLAARGSAACRSTGLALRCPQRRWLHSYW